MDANTGRIKWVFRIRRVPKTMLGNCERHVERYCTAVGGVWTRRPSIFELGMLYVNISNPSPNYDGSSRKGINLFTNSILALDLETASLRCIVRSFITIWDWDLMTGPTLFDVTVNGKPIKALASLAKTLCVRVESRDWRGRSSRSSKRRFPTTTDMPGEAVWPTQPIPYTARNVPQTPFCATYPPNVKDPELAKRRRRAFSRIR